MIFSRRYKTGLAHNRSAQFQETQKTTRNFCWWGPMRSSVAHDRVKVAAGVVDPSPGPYRVAPNNHKANIGSRTTLCSQTGRIVNGWLFFCHFNKLTAFAMQISHTNCCADGGSNWCVRFWCAHSICPTLERWLAVHTFYCHSNQRFGVEQHSQVASVRSVLIQRQFHADRYDQLIEIALILIVRGTRDMTVYIWSPNNYGYLNHRSASI